MTYHIQDTKQIYGFLDFSARALIWSIDGSDVELACERVEGVGVVGREEVINWGLSGPMLRSSGIQWDLRKVDNYECYEEFDWEVQWQKEGDSLTRYLAPSR
ncbi:respiratory-chain NADH dehydrogenase, 49 kDa subunit [Medicago truncatula]|uniref:Respiratory-chain NADH dehydrogenase, 49 kDa subunit n=1 Tax=Medicago truncatula TaxID=3880 RepID=G7LCR4_MEDTR|nr:respiratory-chain NADH dehydrogenase, 49 kDa subunit [Medicago truncatula]